MAGFGPVHCAGRTVWRARFEGDALRALCASKECHADHQRDLRDPIVGVSEVGDRLVLPLVVGSLPAAASVASLSSGRLLLRPVGCAPSH